MKVDDNIRYRPDVTPLPQTALPVSGFIRVVGTTLASAADERMLRTLAFKANTASDVYADTAYRCKLTGRSMPEVIVRVNAPEAINPLEDRGNAESADKFTTQ